MHPDARGLTLAAALLAFTHVASGCTETRRALGEDCLKNGDCSSGICSQLRCGAEPSTIDAQLTAPVPGDAGDVEDWPSAEDAVADVSGDGSDEGSTE